MFVIWKLFGLNSTLSMCSADRSGVLLMRICLESEHATITTEGFDYMVHVFGTNLMCNTFIISFIYIYYSIYIFIIQMDYNPAYRTNF